MHLRFFFFLTTLDLENGWLYKQNGLNLGSGAGYLVYMRFIWLLTFQSLRSFGTFKKFPIFSNLVSCKPLVVVFGRQG